MTDPGESNVLSAPRIGIQILNFNGARWLPELLRSLEHCRYPNKIVYLVDNGSTDGSVGEIRESPLDVRVIELGQDHGFAGAYNKSVPTAWEDGCEWVCLLNTDTLVCEGWLDAVATAGSHASSYGVMGPVHWSWESDRPSAFTKARFAGQLARFESEPLAWADADWIEGSCFFVRRACWLDLAGLDTRYHFYWEDADFCRRAIRRGWNVGLVAGSHVRHYGGGSSNREHDRDKPLKQRYFYLYKLSDPNHPFWRNCLAWLRLLATEINSIATGPQRRAAVQQWTSNVVWMIRRYRTAHAKWQSDRVSSSSGCLR